MEVGKLTVQLRQNKGKGIARRLRSRGLVPGVCYGDAIDAPLMIQLSPKQLKAALDPVKRQNTVIEVTVEDQDNAPTRQLTAMLKEYQVHPIKRDILHVDLISIDRDKPVEADVPIKFIGRAAGLVEGGQLSVIRHHVAVRCKPADIPAKLELDISSLEIGDVLHVANLSFPEGVVSLDAERYAVITCVAPAAEEEKPTAEAAAVPGEGEAAAAPAEGEKKEGEGGDKAK